MDRTVERYNRYLKETEYHVLNVLKQHSLKVIGFSHLKLQTIADLLHISKKTVHRTLKNLDEKGLSRRFIQSVANVRTTAH